MPGGQERILRRRIRSVQAIKKITRAQELIAASRIVRAQQRVHAAQPYSDQITDVVRDLAGGGGEASGGLLAPREQVRRACHVVIVSDRGMCGAYNAAVLRAAEGEIKADAVRGVDYSLVLSGRKAESYFRFRGYHYAASWAGFSENPRYEHAKDIAQRVMGMYAAGEVDRVELIYTRFVSAGFQEVVLRPLVPLEAELLAGGDGGAGGATAGYEFEPSPGAILDTLLRRYVEARVYAALLNPQPAGAPLCRGALYPRPPQSRPLRAPRPPAGHEGGHRQRRRSHHQPVPRHEPRPPGRHHHRDHGDRRWCGGARRRERG